MTGLALAAFRIGDIPDASTPGRRSVNCLATPVGGFMQCLACNAENVVFAVRCCRCGKILSPSPVTGSDLRTDGSTMPSRRTAPPPIRQDQLPAAREYSLIDSMSMAHDGSLRAQVDEDRVLFYRPAAGTNDEYRLQGVLGQGGLGVVFRGVDSRNGKAVAVKRPLFAPGTKRHLVEDLLKEGLAASRVSHPNVLQILDARIDQEGPFLVTELIDGPDLARQVKEHGALEQGRALRLIMAICNGVAAAHAAGLIHRDIKPSNVVTDPGDRPYLLDFGLARSMLDIRIDEASRFLGTPGYVAPEQARNAARSDHRADVFSLGVTLYVMLTGKPPAPIDLGLLPQPLVIPLARATHRDVEVRQVSLSLLTRDLRGAWSPEPGFCVCCLAKLSDSGTCGNCKASLAMSCPACGAATRLDRPSCDACGRELSASCTTACVQEYARALLAAGHLDEAEAAHRHAQDYTGDDPGAKLTCRSQWVWEHVSLEQRAARAAEVHQAAVRMDSQRGPYRAITAYYQASRLNRQYLGDYLKCLAIVNPKALPAEGEAPLTPIAMQKAVFTGDEITANRYFEERQRTVTLAVAAGNTSAAGSLVDIERDRRKIAAKWQTRKRVFFVCVVLAVILYVLLISMDVFKSLDRQFSIRRSSHRSAR